MFWELNKLHPDTGFVWGSKLRTAWLGTQWDNSFPQVPPQLPENEFGSSQHL